MEVTGPFSGGSTFRGVGAFFSDDSCRHKKDGNDNHDGALRDHSPTSGRGSYFLIVTL